MTLTPMILEEDMQECQLSYEQQKIALSSSELIMKEIEKQETIDS